MRLAVIIPCYNHARYIGAAIESCLAQTRRPDRILVIDDGSRDDSPAIIRSFAHRGVEGSARENRGAHSTINELLGMAAQDCDVVSILNSDDHYALDRFEKCLPLLEANPDKQVVVSALRVIDENDAGLAASEPRAKWFRAMWSLHSPERDLCEWLGIGNFPATTSNVIARTAWLQRFPFRPYHFNHDYYFLAQTVLRDAMLVHPDPLVNYRVHGTNTMNSEPAPLLREMLRMTFDLAHDLAPELAADPALRARWARYSRAQWDSISSFHGGLYQTLLAGAAARLTEEEIFQAVTALTTDHYPELLTYPNRSLVNQWDGTSPVTAAIGLTEQFESLRLSEKETKARARAYKELAALRSRLADSRWLALGRALGVWKSPSLPSGPPENQDAALTAALARQPWVRLGKKLGVKLPGAGAYAAS
jgi:hypothetical protein